MSDSDMNLSPAERRRRGRRTAALGTGLNLLLFAGKLAAGILSGAVSVWADAFNSFSDALSSAVTLLGFRIAGRRPDREHPYGHARMEYVSALLTAVAILVMGIELLRDAAEQLLAPGRVEISGPTLVILLVSMAVKAFMSVFCRRRGTALQSQSLLAAAQDARNDVLATAAVLLSVLLTPRLGARCDGASAAAVGIFVLHSGLKTLWETVGTILGRRPDAHLVEEIRSITESHRGILGVHDIMIHDYGPGSLMASLHAEIRADSELLTAHELIEHIQDELEERLGCPTLIHMDPVEPEDDETGELRRLVSGVLCGIEPALTIHDFRVGRHGEGTVLSFDVQTPYGFPLSDDELRGRISRAIGMVRACELNVHVDRGGI